MFKLVTDAANTSVLPDHKSIPDDSRWSFTKSPANLTLKWTRISLFSATTILSILPGFGALADPCDALVSDLRAFVDSDPSKNTIVFHIASNYQDKEIKTTANWAVWYTYGELGAGETFQNNPPTGQIRHPRLSGKGTQTSSGKTFCRVPPVDPSSSFCGDYQNFDQKQAVEVQIDIFSNGSYMTQRQYGPFEAICYDNKFLTSFGASGSDTFTFFKSHRSF